MASYLNDGSHVLMRFWTRSGAYRFCDRFVDLAVSASPTGASGFAQRVAVVRVHGARRYALVILPPFPLPDWVAKAGYWR